MQAVIDKALAKEPGGRFSTAHELASAVRDTMSLPAAAPSTAAAADWKARTAGNTRLGLSVIGIFVLALAGVIGIFRLNPNQVAPAELDNPTEHIAGSITGSSGSIQWRFDCLGDSETNDVKYN